MGRRRKACWAQPVRGDRPASWRAAPRARECCDGPPSGARSGQRTGASERLRSLLLPAERTHEIRANHVTPLGCGAVTSAAVSREPTLLNPDKGGMRRHAGSGSGRTTPASPRQSSPASIQDCGSDRAERASGLATLAIPNLRPELRRRFDPWGASVRGCDQSDASRSRLSVEEVQDGPGSVAASVRREQRLPGQNIVASRLPSEPSRRAGAPDRRW